MEGEELPSNTAGNEELIQQAKAGDVEALGALFMRKREQLERIARAKIGSDLKARTRVSDILQSTFVRALGALPRFAGETDAALTSWLTRILTNTISDRGKHYGSEKRTKRREERGGPSQQENLRFRGPSPSETFALQEESTRLSRALTRLSEDYRRILLLSFDPSYTTRKAAEKLGRTEGATKVLLARARRSLVMELEKLGAAKNDD